MTKLRYNLIPIMNLLALAFTLCMLACSTAPTEPVASPALLPEKADFRITAQTRDPKQGCVKRYNKNGSSWK